MSIAQALAEVRAAPSMASLVVTDFLVVLECSPHFKVDFPQPDAPLLRPGWRPFRVLRRWTKAADALLGTIRHRAVAVQFGRTARAVA
jgi:hypothetical protein